MTDPRREAALARIAAAFRATHHEFLAERSGWRLARFLDVLEGHDAPDATPPSRRLHKRLFVPGLEASPYWEDWRFPIAALLKARTSLICAEAQALLSNPFALQHPPGEMHVGNGAVDGGRLFGAWNAWYLQRYFQRLPLAAVHTPVALRSLDTCQVSREALFSIVGPGTCIATHSDELNFVTTLYLPLIASPGAWIEFDGDRREWCVGECFAADSTFLHQSFNPTWEWRVILIIDLWHPDLAPPEIAILSEIMPQADAIMRGRKDALA